ncbi:MAG: hypothetical protein ACK4VN_12015 [Bacteroidales bacterium]
MNRKMISIFLYAATLLFLAILIVFMTLWVKSPGVSKPITDSEGNPVKESISTIETIRLGGQEQYIIIRGVDASKPVMLFLHGGPGSPEVAFMNHYNREIEND